MNAFLISLGNIAYLHSAFLVTEMTTDLYAKTTWAEIQGYQYHADKHNEKSVNEWNEGMISNDKRNKNHLKLVVVPHIDVFEGEKLLMPGVTPHLRLHRSRSDFALTSVAPSEDKFL